MDNKDIIKRVDALKSQRSVVQDQWELIEKYVTPYRGDFFRDVNTETSVDWHNRNVYDSTAVMAHQILAASLHGALTSPSVRWFDIRFREERLRESRVAKEWLEACSEEVYWSLADSNFNLEVNETYQDLTGFGTAPIMLEEGEKNAATGWGGLMFSAVPLKEVLFEEDAYGQPYRFYRLLKWKPSQILSKFKDSMIPDSVRKADEKTQDRKFDVIFSVFPRPGRKQSKTQLPPTKRPFEYRYVLREGKHTLETGGYYEMPVFIPRWRKTSESCWGNSPAMIALGDILTLNQARFLQLRAAEKLIDPPTFADERAVIGDLDLNPGEHNTLRDINGIKAFDSRGNIQVSDHMVNQLQEAVRDYFYSDQLRMPAPQASPMTATEVQIRYEQMQRLLGPTLGRLQADMLDPLIGRVFKMLARAGRLPEAPEIVQEIDPDYDIEYLGSLARSQKVDIAAAIERTVSIAAGMAQALPETLDAIDGVEVIREIAKAMNVPAAVVRDADEVEERIDERNQREAAMANAAQTQMQGEATITAAEAEEAVNGAQQRPGAVPAVAQQ